MRMRHAQFDWQSVPPVAYANWERLMNRHTIDATASCTSNYAIIISTCLCVCLGVMHLFTHTEAEEAADGVVDAVTAVSRVCTSACSCAIHRKFTRQAIAQYTSTACSARVRAPTQARVLVWCKCVGILAFFLTRGVLSWVRVDVVRVDDLGSIYRFSELVCSMMRCAVSGLGEIFIY